MLDKFNFNTSHVKVYQEHPEMFKQDGEYFNTSHVKVYHQSAF